MTMPLEEKRALCYAVVTLNGKPAVICGAQNEYATVAALPHGESCEWSWHTVKHVVANGGDFHS
jgi:hypothetical protein